MKSLTIIGRRWFQRTYGNTYCTAEVLIDGAPVLKTKMEYGYGDYYMQAAFDQLEGKGLLNPPRTKHANGSYEAYWQWAERNGVTLDYRAIDVRRERDL